MANIIDLDIKSFDVITDPKSVLIGNPPVNERIIWCEWQTWSFDEIQPRVGWSRGICELEEFLFHIRKSLKAAGQTPYWREISISAM